MNSGSDKIMDLLHGINYKTAKIMFRALRDMNVSPPQGRMLFELNRLGGESKLCALAESMDTPYSNASNICGRLCELGLLRRERSESDRRSVVIGLTESGKNTLAEFRKNYYEISSAIFKDFDKEQVADMKRALCELDCAVTRVCDKYTGER